MEILTNFSRDFPIFLRGRFFRVVSIFSSDILLFQNKDPAMFAYMQDLIAIAY
jgi:hypothetical protein